MTGNFIENELIILTKRTFEVMMKSKNNSDVCMLYVFYYYVSKWQKTNKIYCTTAYTAKGLGWTEPRVRKAKKELIEYGLIEDAKTVDSSGKITGSYIHMKYKFSQTAEKETAILSKNHTVAKPQYGSDDTVANQETNAYRDNNKMLTEINNKMLTEEIKKCLSVKEVMNLFNDICISLPRVKMMSDSRKAAIKNLSGVINGDFETLFRKTEQSDFLTGRNGKWKGASFDWCIKKANAIKILEGNYDNRNTGNEYDYSGILHDEYI